tara:strand:- start:722 stop:868 length:147 start_codon:yes stop_codon:yes gene_type:complete
VGTGEIVRATVAMMDGMVAMMGTMRTGVAGMMAALAIAETAEADRSAL